MHPHLNRAAKWHGNKECEIELEILKSLESFKRSEACAILGAVALSLGFYDEARRLTDDAEQLERMEREALAAAEGSSDDGKA